MLGLFHRDAAIAHHLQHEHALAHTHGAGLAVQCHKEPLGLLHRDAAIAHHAQDKLALLLAHHVGSRRGGRHGRNGWAPTATTAIGPAPVAFRAAPLWLGAAPFMPAPLKAACLGIAHNAVDLLLGTARRSEDALLNPVGHFFAAAHRVDLLLYLAGHRVDLLFHLLCELSHACTYLRPNVKREILIYPGFCAAQVNTLARH